MTTAQAHTASTRMAVPSAARKRPRVRLVIADTNESRAPESGRFRIPRVIRKSQRYYWTSAWQAGEATTRRELAEGKGQTFTSLEQLMAALDSPATDD